MGNLIGNLSVNLSLETAAFKQGASLAEKRAETLSARMKGLSTSLADIGKGFGVGLVVGGLGAIAASAFETASSLSEAAAATGVTIEQLQRLRLASEQNGGSAEVMDAALSKLSATLGAVQNGSKVAAAAFEEIGISVAQLKGLNAAQAFALIVEKISAIKDPTLQAAAAKKIFGKSYADVLPLIKGGTAALDEATAASIRNGEITQEEADKLDNLADSWGRFKTRLGVVTADVIVWVQDMVAAIDEFDLQTRQAIDRVYAEIGRLATVGRDMVLGLAKGITDNAAKVWNALRDVVLRGVENVRAFLGIKSPSRVFMDIGDNVSAGLAIGIERGAPKVTASFNSLLQSMNTSGRNLVDLASNNADRLEASNDRISESFATTAQNVLGSLSGLANSIKGGGFLNILESVLGLGLQLGSVGAFGKSIQTRINAPGRARGGNTTSNRSYIVGERGPELFTPNRSGFVTANNQMNKGGGRASVELKITPSPYFDAVVDQRADGRVLQAAPVIANLGAQQAGRISARRQSRSIR